jgi:hypothetical protein
MQPGLIPDAYRAASDQRPAPQPGACRKRKSIRGPLLLLVLWIFIGGPIVAGVVDQDRAARAPQAGTTVGPQAAAARVQPEVQVYLTNVTELIGRGTRAQMQVIDQLELLVGRPMVALTPEWRTPTASGVASLRAAGQGLQARQPVPHRAADLHRRMVLIGGDMTANADEYTAFMDGQGPRHLDIAARRMKAMNSRIAETLPLITALREGR